jgi:hypothetical protein
VGEWEKDNKGKRRLNSGKDAAKLDDNFEISKDVKKKEETSDEFRE